MGKGYPNDWNRRRRKVYRRDNYTCQKCGRKGGRGGNTELHAHHIVPKGKGGSHKLTNLQTLCKSCHAKAHGGSGGLASRPQKGFWGAMHRLADAEKNAEYGGCQSCGKPTLTVRWDRLKFRKKVKVIQCSSCKAMYEERIIESDGERSIELRRVYSRTQITPAKSAVGQELERQAVRTEMDERAARQEAQDTFGVCPNCGERDAIIIKAGLLRKQFKCETCGARLKQKLFSNAMWKMTRGKDKLVGTTLDLLDWEQLAIEAAEDTDKAEKIEVTGDIATSDIAPSPDAESKAGSGADVHRISVSTWRGRVARVLKTDSWMTAADVSQAVTNSRDIDRTLSTSGASSVLSDMMRHDDVVRQKSTQSRFRYEYQLRESAVIE